MEFFRAMRANLCRPIMGLEREFKFFNRFKGGVCMTCAPGETTSAPIVWKVVPSFLRFIGPRLLV